MISVWVLVIYMSKSYNGGPMMIDNIAGKEECVRVQEIVKQTRLTDLVQCIEVKKVKP